MPESSEPTLVRAIGRWSLAALTINCIIGSGIFGLPSQISVTLGRASPFAWIFAAIATALVMACFGWLARLTAAAANANLFVTYLAQFWPSVQEKLPRMIVLTAVLSVLTIV